MFEALATAFVYALEAYAALGFFFALAFLSKGVTTLDQAARGTGLGFRLLMVPGAIALWPWLLLRWATQR